MAESSGQERTEQPTEKKLRESRKKGQIARSRELNTTIAMVVAAIAFLSLGKLMGEQMLNLISFDLHLDRDQAFDKAAVLEALRINVFSGLELLAPFMAIMVLAAFIGPLVMGGWSFSLESLKPKFGKLNPFKGLKRVFGVQGLVELVKALAKFSLLGSISLLFLTNLSDQYLSLGQGSVQQGVSTGFHLILMVFLVLAASLSLVAAIDVPYQQWSHTKKLRMTRQEIKQENKETEGNPEVKGKVRSLQQEMAQRKMLQDIPDADVVIVNPTHFSVALRYDENISTAPRVVATGVDFLALKIREIANANDVPIFSAPPLARALYHHAELGSDIPGELYLAVAQVLAYVFQVEQNISAEPVIRPDNIPVPDDFKVDPDMNHE